MLWLHIISCRGKRYTIVKNYVKNLNILQNISANNGVLYFDTMNVREF